MNFLLFPQTRLTVQRGLKKIGWVGTFISKVNSPTTLNKPILM